MVGYAWGQLRKALATRARADDAETRSRAAARADSWMRVLIGMATGGVRVGSPTPVRGFPAWLTPEIVRGGFATGTAAAAGPLAPDEIALAERAGVQPNRASLFAWFLSDAGLQELDRLLETGEYRLWLPEHGALLTVAYLLRSGRAVEADSILRALEPWASQVRFAPYLHAGSDRPGVHVATVPDVAARLAQKRPRQQVEAEREALTVWAPFTDRVLAHWWVTRSANGEIGTTFPEGWTARAIELLGEYQRLASTHTKTTKHANPKQNLQILLRGMRAAVEGGLDGRTLGHVRSSVSRMVAKRGAPGTAELLTLRDEQGRIASAPSHAALAHDAAERLRASGVTDAVEEPTELLNGLPAAELPSIRAVAAQATQAPLEVLLHRGIVRSAETLAELAPQLTAETVATRYPDPVAGVLAKRTYQSFANRRSVLLTNRRTQVAIGDIPWFSMLEQAAADDTDVTLAKAQALDLAILGMRHFPGTPLPNSLVRELTRLFEIADVDVPLTYELAADIFMGSFSPVFQRAAQEVESLLRGTLYARYYGIDYNAIARLEPRLDARGHGGAMPRSSVPDFDALVHARAGVTPTTWSFNVAANGRVIEQAQILSTQNLAQIVKAGVQLDWGAQARGAWDTTRAHLARTTGAKPLHHRKNAAFAWRQTVFYLSLASRADVDHFLTDDTLTSGTSAAVADWCDKILDGLRDVDNSTTPAEPFLGWTTAPNAAGSAGS